jgi:hypothetical protein
VECADGRRVINRHCAAQRLEKESHYEGELTCSKYFLVSAMM